MAQHSLKDLYDQSAQLRAQKAAAEVGSTKWQELNNKLLSVTCKITSAHMKVRKA
jgi:hypothetical protein